MGHSAIAIELEDGSWVIREFISDDGTKAGAKVIVSRPYTKEEIYSVINNRYGSYETSKLNSSNIFSNIHHFLSYNIHNSNPYDTVYLEGNYYDINFDEIDKNTGDYNLIFNNCAHYVHRILRAGQNDSQLVDFAHEFSISLIPALLHLDTYISTSISPFVNRIGDIIASWFE